MDLQARVLTLDEIDEILEFENSRMIGADSTQDMISSWHARWRREALEHYLPLGWSFAMRDRSQRLHGYFLAQPLLFFRGYTQSLWIEHMSFTSEDVRDSLIEIAYKWGRDKHLQRVLFGEYELYKNGFQGFPVQKISDTIGEAKTT